MKKLIISDMTLKQEKISGLSFKEKIEIAKLLDKLKVSVIEVAPVTGGKVEEVLVKTICSCVKNSSVAMPVNLTETGAQDAWNLIKNAVCPRLQVAVPMSTVQMEYLCHKKPAAMLETICEMVNKAKALCNEVEFVAEDATRSEPEFLREALKNAISCGASTITLCDTAGDTTTDEFIDFLNTLYNDIPELNSVKVAINASDELNMATSTGLAAVKIGVDEIKTASCKCSLPSLESILKIVRARGDSIGVEVDVSLTEFQRASRQILWICEGKNPGVAYSNEDNAPESAEAFTLNEYTDISAISDAVVSMGYDLSEEDMARVYEEFKRAADKKTISLRELDAIVASCAMQVPATYKLASYVINSGNVISSTANMILEKDGKQIAGVCIGDGPIDAAFLAIEQIVGHHYELDDFRINSVTQGREAIGSAFVKLKSNGKVYSGNGVSTDIIDASIRAYISALNKIVYEQNV